MVGRKKGTAKTGGRKLGTPNRVSGSVKEWISSVVDGNRERFEQDLDSLEAGERVRIISNLLQYITPKMQSVSAEELLEAEYKRLERLLEEAPDEAVDLIVERINRLKNEAGRTEKEN